MKIFQFSKKNTIEPYNMNIAIIINDNYINGAIALLNSFFENNPGNHNIFVIFSNLNDSNILKIQKIIKKYNSSLIFKKITTDLFSKIKLTCHFTTEILYKFLIPDLIPIEYKKVLYLDSDIIVLKSLKEIYEINDYEFCAAKSIINTEIKEYVLSINLDPDNYFNSGVILFNLKKIHDSKNNYYIYKDYIDSNYKYLDQDIFNKINQIYNNFKILDKNYNYQIFWNSEYNILKDIYVIHFIGDVKPWMPNYVNTFKFLFNKYYKL